ncbi:hypothetical protein GUITHDRAFT_118549 [Guillardia theta CCMP2712]|uniref:DUF6816 domain-containing protein n=1 Tax=Guillardia theta (strain CCMP2712) TaxID=905079 RepID=L1IGE2_GUITC|nr:hypothetical protein GUITHDRAFT_118549 [Guillardia theta CCMP2712]EKX35316.1 hypothetical protein GUITHDRAFT_118549 [Guillardia theta CCMP2712]|eukprot:XP_005822296.1 hypothetical protein GUITHDRAFT_118549 [Guillardia theta CCMP2712]
MLVQVPGAWPWAGAGAGGGAWEAGGGMRTWAGGMRAPRLAPGDPIRCRCSVWQAEGVQSHMTRKKLMLHTFALLSAWLASARQSDASDLYKRLEKRDPEALSKPLMPSIVAIPVAEQVYPDWLEGTWDVSCKFSGYLLPVKQLSKEQIMRDVEIPGFQKLSIALLPDVGSSASFQKSFRRRADGKVVEDRQAGFTSLINSYVGSSAVKSVTCTNDRDSIELIPGKTRNAERIELFSSSRDSEAVGDIFVCSDYVRQVTYGLSKQFGVARQVVGEYQHFWTFKKKTDYELTANLLTAAYLQVQS